MKKSRELIHALFSKWSRLSKFFMPFMWYASINDEVGFREKDKEIRWDGSKEPKINLHFVGKPSL